MPEERGGLAVRSHRGRAWHQDFLREWRPLILLGVGLCVFAIGWVGYRPYDDGSDRSAAYHSLQLFVLESDDVENPSWTLTVARFAAPLVTVLATVLAVFVLFRDKLAGFVARRFAHDHIVVAGLGDIGSKLALTARASGRRIVAIERDPANPVIERCRVSGISVLTGDAADPEVLRRARLEKARYLVVTGGRDIANLDIVVGASRVFQPSSRKLNVFAHLADLTLWQRLEAHTLASTVAFGFRLQFFNVLEAAARVLVERHPPWRRSPDGDTHVLFVGLDEVGPFALLHIVRRWLDRRGQTGGEVLRFTVLGPRADEQVELLFDREPHLQQLCAIAYERVDVTGARFQRGLVIDAASPAITAAYVCLADETHAYAAALALRAIPATRAVPLVVTVWDAERGIAQLMHDRSERYADITEFAVLNESLVPDVALLGTNEVLARLRHEEYVRREVERGETTATNSSLVPWDDLPESLRESNRAFAAGISRKLADSGCVLIPASLKPVAGAAPLFSDSEIEELARAEHDRWMSDLVLDGWNPTAGRKDPVAKRHPLLVPWEELSEGDRERDRDAIRALPGMLARAGFEVRRVER